jgi:hypothetical protein
MLRKLDYLSIKKIGSDIGSINKEGQMHDLSLFVKFMAV